jgi:alginate O-acetyltransferase complex protein AlgJ
MARLEPLAAFVACCAVTLLARCHPASSAPFPGGGEPVAAEHGQVRTLNEGYARTRSQVLVREVDVPTRAALDYAAYHANFMIADPAPDALPPEGQAPDASQPFGGLLDKATLTADVNRTPLTAGERRHPLAFAPAVTYLESHHVVGAALLEEVATKVRGESWGLPSTPGVSTQAPSEAFLHSPPGAPAEIWVKIEFAPWFTPFKGLPDQDGDGFPEVYGRVRADHAPVAAIDAWKGDYSGRALDARELKTWANELSSYWYPSFNTDLIAPGAVWPDEHTEGDIRKELGGRVFTAPAIVLRGKPEGKATYEVFLVKGALAGATAAAPSSAPLSLPPTRPTPDPAPLAAAVSQELALHGGSWSAWASELSAFHADIKTRLASPPRDAKALAGTNGFLFYRTSLDFVVGGDLESQPPGKNPAPVIVEFKKMLDAHGVDFLFVPVPTKAEIFPDELSPKGKPLVGKVVNPFIRKLAQSLAQQGVEVVDLLTPFLAARTKGGAPGEEPLYQRQDTHWTDRGLRLAAELLAKRIERYPWYPSLARHAQRFGTKDATFTRFGDLHSRLPEAKKRGYQPETLSAKQVLRADGTPYEDEAESPIVLLGDSFTGVYELTDAEHAGLSAHMARGISYPIDLVMSYGGGPNVRAKLMRRGTAALGAKKLVVWVMTARDLYKYWEAWEPLERK